MSYRHRCLPMYQIQIYPIKNKTPSLFGLSGLVCLSIVSSRTAEDISPPPSLPIHYYSNILNQVEASYFIDSVGRFV